MIRLVQELDKSKEQLEIECDKAFSLFVSRVIGANNSNHEADDNNYKNYETTNYETYRSVIQAVSQLDCLMSLAAVSAQPHYVQAQYVDEPCLRVTRGRHPIVEQHLLDRYVPNDCTLGGDGGERAVILTGPNMGGKSSYVRQVALIAIMAQIGSYVPADAAQLGILDAVYTRMGAYDNIMSGESTFKVELKECCDIMKSATNRSLVILDEIGRGTGTMDGVAIAYAVLKYFIGDLGSLTLFVTHYPGLAEFEWVSAPGVVKNYHMGFLETPTNEEEPQENEEPQKNDEEQSNNSSMSKTEITFLYTLVPGIAHKSYGLNVARLARIPESVIEAAQVMSSKLENEVMERSREKVSRLVMQMIKRAREMSAEGKEGERRDMSEREMANLKILLS